MKAAIYVRQSEDKAGSGAAVARQLDECQSLATRMGLEVCGLYSDNDVSASTNKQRPEWARLLRDIEAGNIDTLVCWHTDRLYRRLRDLVDLVELAETHALRIVAVRAGDIDLGTPAGRMLAGMLGSAARYEVEQKGIRQREANRQRARKGVSIWSRRPYGFDRRGHDVYVVPEEAVEIRRMVDAIFDGKTLGSIVRDLNDRNVTTTLGGKWYLNAVTRTVRNPRIAGRVTYNGEDYGQGDWEPIVSSQEFDRLNALLKDPKRRTSNDTRLKYLLSGILICDACDMRMFATTANSRTAGKYLIYLCKGCKRARKLEHVDDYVQELVLTRLQNEDIASLLAVDVDVAELQREADELRQRRESLAALLADGILTVASVKEQSTKLQQRIRAIEESIGRAIGDTPLTDLHRAPDIVEAWHNLGVRQRRGIIDTLMSVRVLAAGKGVRFDPNQLSIEWKG